MTNAIDVRSVSRAFGRTQALRGVDFAVERGAICGLFGRNGAGKTTLMSILSGQDRPTSGTVEVFGHEPFERAKTLSKVSYVRDNQRYPDDYRLKHVLRIAPEFAPNWSAELAEELVEQFRIPTRPPIKKFSRGQLSAVAIVLGLASRAPVTLFDEPYLGLDVAARQAFYDILLRDVQEHPRTVLMSTHLIDEAEGLFSQVVVVDRGAVVIDSDPDSAKSLAFVASGAAAAVDEMAASRTVLREHSVGSLKSATLSGKLDAVARDQAEALGIELRTASLQDLVAAYGSGTAVAESTSSRDTAEGGNS